MSEKILITGAGGCIGSWAMKLLMESGRDAVAFDLHDDRRRLELLCDDPADAKAAVWETGDISDDKRVTEVFAKHKPAQVIHLAALQVPFCKADPVGGARVNVVGSINIFEAALAHGCSQIAYASSIASNAMGEQSQWLETLYGAYKFCNEQTARVYWKDKQLASVGIRPNVVYGPARDQGMSSAPTKAMAAAALGQEYVVPFTGPVGFVYASEAADAFIRAVAAVKEDAPVFDLSGETRTVADVLQKIHERYPDAKVSSEGNPLPFPSDLSDEPLHKFMGGSTRVDFDKGFDLTIDFFARRAKEGRFTQ